MVGESKQDATFNAAKQLYAEQFGDAIVTNTYLKIALLAMAFVAAGLIYTNVKTVHMVQNFKPLVIRISDIGRAEAVTYDTLGYKPQDGEIKYSSASFAVFITAAIAIRFGTISRNRCCSWKRSSGTALPRHIGKITR